MEKNYYKELRELKKENDNILARLFSIYEDSLFVESTIK
jgi:hypothetical protein